MLICATERLLIRRLRHADADFVFRLVNQASWIEHIGDRGVHSINDAEGYIESCGPAQYKALGYGMNLVELRSNAARIGLCGLVSRAALPQPDLGFAFLEEFWGHGYALEAAAAMAAHARSRLGIGRLLAVTTPANDRSARLLAKLGFRREGSVRLAPDDEELNLYAS